MNKEYKEYIEDEMRADAQNYYWDALWSEFELTYSENDLLEEYEQHLGRRVDADEIEKWNDDFEEFKQMLFNEYCENRD
jgi:hypothetical protein